MNRRVVPFARHGFAQGGFRRAQLVLFEINPAETVKIRRRCKGLPSALAGPALPLRQAVFQVTQHVAVIFSTGAFFGFTARTF